MSVLIVAAGLLLFAVGCFFLLKGIFLLIKSGMFLLWFRFISSEKKTDQAYMKNVLEKSPEYLQHGDAVDQTVNDILNG